MSIIIAPANTAIAVVRLSGGGCVELGEKLCGTALSRELKLVSLGGIDQCTAAAFRAPRSYTGEDCLELYLHNSPAVINAAIDLFLQNGARPAKPGEFTRRACENGKLDLIRAEAVGDLIAADSPAAAQNALAQLKGNISRDLEHLWNAITDLAAVIAAETDYPDDDITPAETAQIAASLTEISAKLRALLESHARGKIIKNGVRVAIAGKPNVGKSSLFNALLGRDRAIVTPIAGTTRDTVEDSVIIGGTRFVFADTAGLRDTDDPVEREGVSRARDAIGGADVVIALSDPEDELADADISLYGKADLHAKRPAVSPKTGEGIAEIIEKLKKFAPRADGSQITNARHADCLRRALESAEAARVDLERGIPPDVVLGLIEDAAENIGEILGKNANFELLDKIFANFCIGK